MKASRNQSVGGGGNERGVTLLELSIVVGIMLVVAAASVPTMMTAVQQYRLRAAGKNLAAMLQSARMRCVRDNRNYIVQDRQVAVGSQTYSQLFLDQNSNGAPDAGEPFMQLPRNMRFNNASAPALSAATLDFTPQPPSVPLHFNAIGLPCVVRNGICTNWDASGNAVGVVYFLQDTRTAASAWAAVSVSPAGRVRTWTWQGSSVGWQP